MSSLEDKYIKCKFIDIAIRNIGEKHILIDIANNRVFILSETTSKIISKILKQGFININEYSKENNIEFNAAMEDIELIIKFLDYNKLIENIEVCL